MSSRHSKGRAPTAPPTVIRDPSQQSERSIVQAMRRALDDHYPDQIFRSKGRLVELIGGKLSEITPRRGQALLSRAVSIIVSSKKGERYVKTDIHWANLVVNTPEVFWRELLGVVNHPFLAPGMRIVAKPGYDKKTMVWFEWAGKVPDPEGVTVEEIQDVLQRLLDFPWVDTDDEVAALALYLTPLVRPAIDGPTPLHLICTKAGQRREGIGKTMLGRMVGLVALGHEPVVKGLDQWSSEASRQLVAYLLKGGEILFIDNLSTNALVGSADLHRYLTTEDLVDVRPLGTSESRETQCRATWIATLIDPNVDPEQARRTILIRLRQRAEGEERITKDLAKWVKKHRVLILSVLLRFVQVWIDSDPRPRPTRNLDGFADWSNLLGGVLIANDFRNADEVWLAPDHRPIPAIWSDWERLWKIWPDEEGKPERISATNVVALVDQAEAPALSQRIEATTERGRGTRMGLLLREMVENKRVIAGKVLHVKTTSDGRVYWPDKEPR